MTATVAGECFFCNASDRATLDRNGLRFETDGRFFGPSAPREGSPPGTC